MTKTNYSIEKYFQNLFLFMEVINTCVGEFPALEKIISSQKSNPGRPGARQTR